MTENLDLSHGLVYSQRVLLKLTDAGLARQVAYESRPAARDARLEGASAVLRASRRSHGHEASDAEDLKGCFDPAFYLRNVDAIFKRLGLTR